MEFKPKTVFIELTDQCNLRCKHCIKAAGPDKKNYMAYEKIRKIFYELFMFKTDSVILTGGEPLLHKDFFKILDLGCQAFEEVMIDTNGTLIDEQMAKKLSAYKNLSVQVSLDGATEEVHNKIRIGQDPFKKTIQAIKNLVNVGIIPTIATTLNQYNYLQIEQFYSLLKNLKIVFWRIMVTMKQGRAIENYRELELTLDQWNTAAEKIQKLPKDIEIDAIPMFKFMNKELSCADFDCMGCEAGKYRVNILVNGDVIPCSMLPTFITGNLFQNSFTKIWNESEIMNEFRSFDYTKIKECSSCKHLKYCKGGCHGTALEFSGSIYHKDPRCPIKNEAC